jgi:hypothetical protein
MGCRGRPCLQARGARRLDVHNPRRLLQRVARRRPRRRCVPARLRVPHNHRRGAAATAVAARDAGAAAAADDSGPRQRGHATRHVGLACRGGRRSGRRYGASERRRRNCWINLSAANYGGATNAPPHHRSATLSTFPPGHCHQLLCSLLNGCRSAHRHLARAHHWHACSNASSHHQPPPGVAPSPRVSWLSEGDTFGEAALLDPSRRRGCTVVAGGGGVQLATLDRAAWDRLPTAALCAGAAAADVGAPPRDAAAAGAAAAAAVVQQAVLAAACRRALAAPPGQRAADDVEALAVLFGGIQVRRGHCRGACTRFPPPCTYTVEKRLPQQSIGCTCSSPAGHVALRACCCADRTRPRRPHRRHAHAPAGPVAAARGRAPEAR